MPRKRSSHSRLHDAKETARSCESDRDLAAFLFAIAPSNFAKSVLDQTERGRTLTERQRAAVKRILKEEGYDDGTE